MATRKITGTIQIRQDTNANWGSKNPVLASGEFGLDKTNNILKIGDGTTKWSSLLPIVDNSNTLNGMSWTSIQEISDTYRAPTVFNIGDEKTITLKSGLELTIVILDFWHDVYYNDSTGHDDAAGITFGLKTYYPNLQPSMNPDSDSNSGGWETCYVHDTVLPGIFELLPDDLQAVIKPVRKYTTVGDGNSYVDFYWNNLFLLSEVEVTGTDEDPYSLEGTQYAYFRRNNVQQNYLGDDYAGEYDYGNPNYAKGAEWWLRSPSITLQGGFRCVNDFGVVDSRGSADGYNICFAFCV